MILVQTAGNLVRMLNKPTDFVASLAKGLKVIEAVRALQEGAEPAVVEWTDRAVEELSLALGRLSLHDDVDPRYAAELVLVR